MNKKRFGSNDWPPPFELGKVCVHWCRASVATSNPERSKSNKLFRRKVLSRETFKATFFSGKLHPIRVQQKSRSIYTPANHLDVFAEACSLFAFRRGQVKQQWVCLSARCKLRDAELDGEII